MKMFKVSILAVLFSSVSISGALAEEVFFSCKYSHYADDSLEIFKAENFDLQFIWRDDGIAVMVGNNGATEVMTSMNNRQITFIEQTTVGNIMLTTIDLNTLKSVHSRHTVIDILLPSQYYGQCDVK